MGGFGAFGGKKGGLMQFTAGRESSMFGSNQVTDDMLEDCGGDPEAMKIILAEAINRNLKKQKLVFE